MSLIPMSFAPSPFFDNFGNNFGNYWSWPERMMCATNQPFGEFTPEEWMMMRPSSMEEFCSLKNPIVIDTDGKRKMKMMFDLKNFKPEEVEIKTEKGMVTVSAKHEMKTPESYVCRNYCRTYAAPKGTDMKATTATFNRDGFLTIEAPIACDDKTSVCKVESCSLPIKHL